MAESNPTARLVVVLLALGACTPELPIIDGGVFDPNKCVQKPEDIDFGVIQPPTMVTRAFTLKNPTTRTLYPEVGEATPPFSTGIGRVKLDPRQEITLFVGVSVDGRAAISRIPFKGGLECPQDSFLVQLRAEGRVIAIPSMLDFGAVPRGAERTLEVVLASSRPTSVLINKVRLADTSAATVFTFPVEPFVLEANGGTHALPVTFHAITSGTRTSTLVLDGEGVAFSVPLSGTTGGPIANVSPSALTVQVPYFGDAPGASFIASGFTLFNVGDGTQGAMSSLRLSSPIQVEALTGSDTELCVGRLREDAGCVSFTTPALGIDTNRHVEVPLVVMAKTPGPKQWTLHVRTNDITAPERLVNVSADTFEPAPCELSISRPTFDAGLDPRSPAVALFTFVNGGATDCLIDDVQAEVTVTRSTTFPVTFPDAGTITIAEGAYRVDAGATLVLPVVVHSGVPNSTVEGFVSAHPLRADAGVERVELGVQFR